MSEPVAWIRDGFLEQLHDDGGHSGIQTVLWLDEENPGKRHSKRIPLYAAPPPPAAVQETVAVKALRDTIIAGIKDQGYGYTLKGDKLTVSSDEVFAVDIAKLATFIRAALSQTDHAPEIAALRAEIERLRDELACTYEELINHNGDDLNDNRSNRVSQLRAAVALQRVAKGERG